MSNQLAMPKFLLGKVVMTRSVSLTLINHDVLIGHEVINHVLSRHASGDWGDLDEEDLEANEYALKNGDRLFSSYNIDCGSESKLWVITEYDRSVTTVLFPSDY